MAILRPKVGNDKQDLAGGYTKNGCSWNGFPAVESDPENPDGGTPFSWICGECDVTIPTGADLAVSVVTALGPSGFRHFDGVQTTVDIFFPNTIVGSTDYISPTVNDNADGTVTITFVEGTTRQIDVCAVIANNCNSALAYNQPTTTLTFTDNGGNNNNIVLNFVSDDGDNIITDGTDSGAYLSCDEVLDCGAVATEVNVNASAAGDQLTFDGLLPAAFPDGYTQIHIYIDMGANTYTLDNFISSYGQPTHGIPIVYIHNVTTSSGKFTVTMPKTGNVVQWGSDDIVALSYDHLGNWTLVG